METMIDEVELIKEMIFICDNVDNKQRKFKNNAKTQLQSYLAL